MRIPVKLDLALIVARIVLIAALLPFAIGWRTPLFASWRYLALAVLLVLPLALIAAEIWTLRTRTRRALRLMSGASLALAFVAFGATAAFELEFQYKRRAVLAADPQQLEKLGRHLLVGYRSAATLQALVERRALAGVFVSAGNVAGKTSEAIRRTIDDLQNARQQQGATPLWIATDQEGGAVSRLSPPLTRMPPIAEIVALHRDRCGALARDPPLCGAAGARPCGARRQPQLRPGGRPEPRRAQSGGPPVAHRDARDLGRPNVVTDVAGVYCATLRLTGVHCTLKHFPGLGRVYEDTHKVTAELAARPSELEASDWLPFRQLMSEEAFTMLGHARLTAIDRDRPASFSHAVVKGLLREQWKHDGILVTDDFSMGAVTLSREGPAQGAIAALNAGVDLILISYDPDQYFPVMHALLAADRNGTLRSEALARSAARLRRAAGR